MHTQVEHDIWTRVFEKNYKYSLLIFFVGDLSLSNVREERQKPDRFCAHIPALNRSYIGTLRTIFMTRSLVSRRAWQHRFVLLAPWSFLLFCHTINRIAKKKKNFQGNVLRKKQNFQGKVLHWWFLNFSQRLCCKDHPKARFYSWSTWSVLHRRKNSEKQGRWNCTLNSNALGRSKEYLQSSILPTLL